MPGARHEKKSTFFQRVQRTLRDVQREEIHREGNQQNERAKNIWKTTERDGKMEK